MNGFDQSNQLLEKLARENKKFAEVLADLGKDVCLVSRALFLSRLIYYGLVSIFPVTLRISHSDVMTGLHRAEWIALASAYANHAHPTLCATAWRPLEIH